MGGLTLNFALCLVGGGRYYFDPMTPSAPALKSVNSSCSRLRNLVAMGSSSVDGGG